MSRLLVCYSHAVTADMPLRGVNCLCHTLAGSEHHAGLSCRLSHGQPVGSIAPWLLLTLCWGLDLVRDYAVHWVPHQHAPGLKFLSVISPVGTAIL